MQANSRYTRWLWFILIMGLILRVLYTVSQPTVGLFDGADGGDTAWYLANGWGFFSGEPHGWIRNMPFYLSSLPSAPFYILYAGIFQQFLPDEHVILTMRLSQCLIGTLTTYFAYRIGWRITGNRLVGLVACALLSFHPSYIIESSNIATETFYIFFLTIGLWLYIDYIVQPSSASNNRFPPSVWIILIGIAFGLGTLTRAVLLLFPIGIVIHMLMIGWRNQFGLWFWRGLLLLIVYSAVVLTWTIYNLGMWGTFVIGSNQFMPALWRGAVQNDGSPAENDALLIENPEDVRPDGCEVDCKYQHATETYVEQINESIGGNIGGFIVFRASELASSYMQPYGTTPLGSVSIRDGLVLWVRDNRSLDGLITLLQTEGFFVKLIIWGFHYLGIVFGAIGMWLTRKSWRLTLPLIGFVVYTTLIHFILLALPRYIFPVEVPLLIFAAVTLVMISNKFRRNVTPLETVIE
jgi:4-amino-4-deoxy-L-arabinose transferase-like glycosyltransferase